MELQLFPVTLAIIAATGLISWQAFQRPEMLSDWMLNPYSVKHHKRFDRIIKHGFVHANWGHLILNMYVLYAFGSALESWFSGTGQFALRDADPVLGRLKYAVLYIGAILVAAAPALSKHGDSPHYNSLGASGGTSALVMAFILLFPDTRLLLFFVLPLPAVLAGVLFFVYEISMQRRGGTGVAHDAHIYGALYGVLFMIVVDYRVIGRFFRALMEMVGI